MFPPLFPVSLINEEAVILVTLPPPPPPPAVDCDEPSEKKIVGVYRFPLESIT
jgi:hypothetical protein